MKGQFNESPSVFVLVTQNVLDDNHTRDWVSYEIGFAKGLEKGTDDEKRIFAWLINVDGEDELAYLKSVTDYKPINLEYEEIMTVESGTEYRFNPKDIDNLVQQIKEIASKIIKLQEMPVITTPN